MLFSSSRVKAHTWWTLKVKHIVWPLLKVMWWPEKVKVGQTAYHSIGLDHTNTMVSKSSRYIFPIKSYTQKTYLRSSDWPDLRSPKSKNRDIQLLDTTILMKVRTFKVVQEKTVDLVRLLNFLVRWGHVTWPGDLTFCDLGKKTFTKVVQLLSGQVGEKPRGGASKRPPPCAARVKSGNMRVALCTLDRVDAADYDGTTFISYKGLVC